MLVFWAMYIFLQINNVRRFSPEKISVIYQGQKDIVRRVNLIFAIERLVVSFFYLTSAVYVLSYLPITIFSIIIFLFMIIVDMRTIIVLNDFLNGKTEREPSPSKFVKILLLILSIIHITYFGIFLFTGHLLIF